MQEKLIFLYYIKVNLQHYKCSTTNKVNYFIKNNLLYLY
jgi:hypothetical protein